MYLYRSCQLQILENSISEWHKCFRTAIILFCFSCRFAFVHSPKENLEEITACEPLQYSGTFDTYSESGFITNLFDLYSGPIGTLSKVCCVQWRLFQSSFVQGGYITYYDQFEKGSCDRQNLNLVDGYDGKKLLCKNGDQRLNISTTYFLFNVGTMHILVSNLICELQCRVRYLRS